MQPGVATPPTRRRQRRTPCGAARFRRVVGAQRRILGGDQTRSVVGGPRLSQRWDRGGDDSGWGRGKLRRRRGGPGYVRGGGRGTQCRIQGGAKPKKVRDGVGSCSEVGPRPGRRSTETEAVGAGSETVQIEAKGGRRTGSCRTFARLVHPEGEL